MHFAQRMKQLTDFFQDLDKEWGPSSKKIHLRIIGSGALMLQTNYVRRTKDADALETAELGAIQDRIYSLAGKGSPLFQKHHVYFEIVSTSLPLLPPNPVFHPIAILSGLSSFQVSALNITDVAVSKLRRFNGTDQDDIRAMILEGLLKRDQLVERFLLAVDGSMGAEGHDMHRCAKNLNRIERDFFGLAETDIQLPEWMDR